jgi:phosphoglucosamine mutase
MLESALTAGLTSMGMNVLLVGPLPTPAISFLTRALRCDAGIMLSASHNPAVDNGIKLFDHLGRKLSKEKESDIEALIENPADLVSAGQIGRATRIDDAHGRYAEHLKARVPSGVRFDGLRVVLDAANGAAYKVAPAVLWELGAEVIPVGVSPNGRNINDACGSTHPQAAAAKVLETRADLGICLDGDADRVILIDNKGQIVDGDQLLAVLAEDAMVRGTLKGPLVGTVMCNVGLEGFLSERGIPFTRSAVGDKNVVEKMRAEGATLGGENSGHIILGQHGATGDGLLAGLQVMAALRKSKKTAADFLHRFEPAPQMMKNVRVKRGSKPHETEAVQAVIKTEEDKIKATGGRVLVRASGTEPLIRVMAEGPDVKILEQGIDIIIDAITAVPA